MTHFAWRNNVNLSKEQVQNEFTLQLTGSMVVMGFRINLNGSMKECVLSANCDADYGGLKYYIICDKDGHSFLSVGAEMV